MIAIILYYYMYLIIYREKTKARRRKGQRLDDLTSCPPRPLPRPSPPSGDKGKAEQKSKKKGRKRENQGEGCRRPLRPFLASPSVPSDVFTVHTIASRSPLRPLLSALRERDGRPPRPLLGDAIATPRHHIGTDRPAASDHRAAPRRSAIMPSPSTPSPVLPFRLRLRFLLFFALISSARSHLFALPSSCSSFLALLPAD